MSTSLATVAAPTAEVSAARPAWRLIPAFETQPEIVRLAQTVPGKLAIVAIFSSLTRLQSEYWLGQSCLVLLLTFLPKYRRAILSCGTLYCLIFRNSWCDWDMVRKIAGAGQAPVNFALLIPIAVATFLAIAAAYCWIAFRWRSAWFTRRPILVMGGCYGTLLLAACYAPVTPGGRVDLWTAVLLLGTYFWFMGYTLLDRNSRDRDPLYLQMGTWFPFWVGSSTSLTPFPKGAAYLRRIEARTAEGLAVTQIKGLKLLLWTMMLSLTFAMFRLVTHTWLHIPPFPEVFGHSVARHRDPRLIEWASLIVDFLETLLNLTIWTNAIVVCCRMAGFRAFRNVYRPFRARTIAEFWNRYYYYFKELLVEFFFYPAFARYFKRHRRLRVFFATFSAATVGQLVFHFMRDIHYVPELGLGKALAGFHVYGFHCLVLGIAIGSSQLRGKKRPANGHWFRDHMLPTGLMLSFFCLLHIFNYFGRTCPITEHFRFLLSLIGFY